MMVRVRLPRSLRSQFDSMDFVQAVWQSVFAGRARTWAGSPTPGTSAASWRGWPGTRSSRSTGGARGPKKYDLEREEPLYVARASREVPREVAAPDPIARARTPRPATDSPSSSRAGAPWRRRWSNSAAWA